MRRSCSSELPLTNGGPLRIFPEASSRCFGGGLQFSPTKTTRQLGIANEPRLPSAPDVRPPPLGSAVRGLPRAADDRARCDHRERRAAVDPARPPLHPGEPDLGRQRLPRHVREPPPAGGPARRSGRPQARLPGRRYDFHAGLAALRHRPQLGSTDRRTPSPGGRGGRTGVGDPRDHRHRVP